MKTKFTEIIDWFNTIINLQEKGSERYKELVREKHRYIEKC